MPKYTSVAVSNLLPVFRDRLKALGYRKRTVMLGSEVADEQPPIRSYWDGGSRTEYRGYDSKGQPIAIPVSGAPGFTAEPKRWTPNDGEFLIETGTCLGKPATAYITLFTVPLHDDLAEANASWVEDDWASQYDDDPSPYDGTYSEE